jgi:ABC-type multidrug transport system fused ATPase/permease subunit
VLEDGQIVEQGRHDELMARNGLYHQTYQSQLSTTQGSRENSSESS